MISDKDTIRMQSFGGVDNRTPETRLSSGGNTKDGVAPSMLRQLVNLEVARGKLRLRKGYELAVAMTAPHSLWSDGARAFVASGTLHQFDGATAADLGQEIVGPTSFETLHGETYFSDGLSTGVIQSDGSIRSWGLDSPPMPDLTVTPSGGLYEGQYQVALTYLMQTGEESGAGLASVVQVGPGGGIAVGLPSDVPEDAYTVAIYVSDANGSTLRMAMGVIAGQTTAFIGTGTRGRELRTQFLSRMPPGTIVRAAHGRLWSVLGDMVTASEPLRYGLTDSRANWLRWPEPITLFEPVDTGFFIGSSFRVAFLQGLNPNDMQTRDVSGEGAIAPLRVKATVLGMQGSGDVVVWFTKRGWAYGLSDGSVTYPTDSKLALPEYADGAGAFIEQDGLKQLLAVVKTAGSSSAAAGDSVTTQVIRNGVVID